MRANEIRHKKNVDIRWPKGYTDGATQVKMFPLPWCVFLSFDKNACSILVYAPATETMYIETCVAANGAAFFVRSFGCAFFIFRSLHVLFVIVLRAIQDGTKTV